MAPQTGKNIIVAYKVEATLDVAPGASGAEQLRLNASPGLGIRKEAIRSNEVRSDLLSTRPRHGSRMVDGSYSGEVSVGTYDTIFEALMRASSVAAVVVTALTASLAEIITGSQTIEATTTGAGGWAAAGIRVGDVFRLTGQNAANNNLTLRAKSMTTHTLTVHGSPLTIDASGETAFVITIGKKLSNPATAVRRSFYIDEYNTDFDQSESFGGCRFTGFGLTGSPNGMAELNLSVLGMSVTAQATGSSPFFTSPTQFTTDPLVFADAKISLGGNEITVATAVELNYEITAETLPVVGASVTPDVFDNDARLSGSLTLLREDLTLLTNFLDEDELELHVMLEEPGTVPNGYIGFYVPKLVLMNLEAPLGADGAMVQTIPWEAGVRTSATGFDQTLLTITTAA